MKSHQLMRYSKKEWHCFTGDENYLMFMIDHIVPTLILDMPCRIDGMLKNPLKNSIHFKEEIQKAFADTLQILEEYVNYENIIRNIVSEEVSKYTTDELDANKDAIQKMIWTRLSTEFGNTDLLIGVVLNWTYDSK